MLFTNSTVSPLATVILLAAREDGRVKKEVSFCFQSLCSRKKRDSRSLARAR